MDPAFTPNQYYEYSPLLFWAMVVTGARRYPEDPTLLPNLGPKVCSMALQSLNSLHQYVQLIQALLVMSSWPVPIETIFKDQSPVLCGVAMQLALQHGLHLSEARQAIGFQQMRSERDEEASRIGSMRCNDHTLWTYCKIVCQR
jgi:transcriptional regulatory protein LEU3